MWFRSGGGSECGWPLPQDLIAQEFGRKELSRALPTPVRRQTLRFFANAPIRVHVDRPHLRDGRRCRRIDGDPFRRARRSSGLRCGGLAEAVGVWRTSGVPAAEVGAGWHVSPILGFADYLGDEIKDVTSTWETAGLERVFVGAIGPIKADTTAAGRWSMDCLCKGEPPSHSARWNESTRGSAPLRTQLWMARCRTTSANRRRSGFTLRDVLSGLVGAR